MTKATEASLKRIAAIIEQAESRAVFVDGPVRPTHEVISHDELCAIYALAKGKPESWRARHE